MRLQPDQRVHGARALGQQVAPLEARHVQQVPHGLGLPPVGGPLVEEQAPKAPEPNSPDRSPSPSTPTANHPRPTRRGGHLPQASCRRGVKDRSFTKKPDRPRTETRRFPTRTADAQRPLHEGKLPQRLQTLRGSPPRRGRPAMSGRSARCPKLGLRSRQEPRPMGDTMAPRTPALRPERPHQKYRKLQTPPSRARPRPQNPKQGRFPRCGSPARPAL